MKNATQITSRRSGFTLVELLVVIAIIAILAGVIGVSVSSAIKFAKRTKASAIAVQIQTAVENYYTEYGVYPVNTGTPPASADDYYDGSTGGTKWKNLTIALCGNIDPATGVTAATTYTGNSRNIPFLTPTRSDLDTSFPAPNDTLKNPFATSSNPTAATQPAPYFYMVIDTDYSGIAGDNPTPAQLLNFTATTTTALGHGVAGGIAVWCACDQVGLTGTKSASWAHTY